MADTYEDANLQLQTDFAYQQYSQPVTPLIAPTQFSGDINIVTTINGSTGPIVFSSPDGFAFTGGTGGQVVFTVSNAATARAALGAAASGVNTDITELNGASQVDVSSRYEVAGIKVVGAQQPAIPDTVDPTTNLILAAMRAHGLIAT